MTTIGCELEGCLVDNEGTPLDTLKVLDGGWSSQRFPFESVTADMGKPSVELITTPCESADEIRESLHRCATQIPHHANLVLKPRTFEVVEIVDKPRARAMLEALSQEHPRGHLGQRTVAPWCATQFHIGVDDVFSDKSIMLLNILNHIAPFMRKRAIERYKIQGAEGHLGIWQGWCDVRRVPAPRWFDSAKQLRGFVARIPKLVTQKDGQWKPAQNQFSSIGDLESEGTLWWAVRPRGVYRTIEVRVFPSMEIQLAVELAAELFRIMHLFEEYYEMHLQKQGWNSKAIRNFMRITGSFLVPPDGLNRNEWWRMYNE